MQNPPMSGGLVVAMAGGLEEIEGGAASQPVIGGGNIADASRMQLHTLHLNTLHPNKWCKHRGCT